MIIHVVKQNETIYKIAKLYNVSPQRIITDNGLSSQPYLVTGQALAILIPDIVHTVRSGESLYSIAKSYNTTEIELIQKNPALISNPILRRGEQITITFKDEGSDSIYIYGYVYPHVSKAVLHRALPCVTSCAIFGYGIRRDGTLVPIDDQEIINSCYKFKTAPVMLLTSLSDEGTFNGGIASIMFNDISLQSKVLDNMIEIMKDKGYLAADLDFEYINPEDSEAYVRFVENTAEKMHQNGFTVNIDLAPKTSTSQAGTLYEGHNYAALGEAADTVLIMTYEWGYTYGPPMAVAPLSELRKVISYSVSQIDNKKIYMGIPNYGYDWQLPFEKGISRATSIGNEYAVNIAAKNGVSISFDETAQSPYFEYYAKDGRKHIVWFEDVRSISKKFELINEFNLRGGGYWNLMRPFDQNWAFLSASYDIRKIVY